MVLLVASVAGCNRPTSEQFDLVRAGMTQEEVRDLLGTPSSQRAIAPDDQPLVGYAERWQYGDNLSSLATDALFPDVPDERVFAVFFDAQGRVLEARQPVSPGRGASGAEGGAGGAANGGGGGLIGRGDPWGTPMPGGANSGTDWSR